MQINSGILWQIPCRYIFLKTRDLILSIWEIFFEALNNILDGIDSQFNSMNEIIAEMEAECRAEMEAEYYAEMTAENNYYW